MRIGIEAQRIFRLKKHGMDMVALELIRNLQEVDKENQYYIFVRKDEDHSVLKETPNFHIVELAAAPYPVWEQLLLPMAVRKYRCDILHCTSNTAPLFPGVPLVLTLHDIIFMEGSWLSILLKGGNAYQRFGNAYRRAITPALIHKARMVATVSAYEKNTIEQRFPVLKDGRLQTVYNGKGAYFQPVTDPLLLEEVRNKYQLPENYLFFLGNTHPKKNTRRTVAAFLEYLRAHPSNLKLVMIDYDRAELKAMLESLGAADLIDSIVLTGYIRNTDLPAIYSMATGFLYPSLRESFGIPIIEAMASGVPVITSNTSSMPEIAGDAALLVDPFDIASIRSAIGNLVEDPAQAARLREKGLQQAARFSWKHMAEQYLEQYQTVLTPYTLKLKNS